MKLITRIYQICGLDFAETNFISIFGISRKFLVHCVLLLHFGYISINLKLQYNLNVELFKIPDVFGNTTNLLEMLLPLLCHFVVVSESFYKRRKQEKITILMEKIRLHLNCNLHAKSTNLPLVKFLFLFAINSLIFVAVFIMVRGTPGMHICISFMENFKLERQYLPLMMMKIFQKKVQVEFVFPKHLI